MPTPQPRIISGGKEGATWPGSVLRVRLPEVLLIPTWWQPEAHLFCSGDKLWVLRIPTRTWVV